MSFLRPKAAVRRGIRFALFLLFLLLGNKVLIAQNVAPTAVDDSYSTGLNTTLNVPANGVISNDIDPNGTSGLTVNPTPVVAPANGALTLNSDGSFDYVPNTGFSGTDSFEYQVCDDGTPNEIVSRFDFDDPNLALATIGPDATAVSPLAAQTGCGIHIASGAGGNIGIDVFIPNTGGIFDFTSFRVDFEYQDQENTADIVTAGNFRLWHITGNNLGAEVQVIDGNTGLPATYSINLGGFRPGNNPYTVEYDELTGDIIYTVNATTVTFPLAPAYSPLNTTLATQIHVGRFMDNSGSATPSLCSIQFTDTSKLCDTGLVSLTIPTSVITNRRITYRVNRN